MMSRRLRVSVRVIVAMEACCQQASPYSANRTMLEREWGCHCLLCSGGRMKEEKPQMKDVLGVMTSST